MGSTGIPNCPRRGLSGTVQTMGPTDWGTAVVVDPKELHRLEADSRKLGALRRGRALAAVLLVATGALSVCVAYRQHSTVSRLRVKVHECRANAAREQTPPACANLDR